MIYRVIITPRARIEFYNDALWWAENRSLDQAKRWLDGFEHEIESLSNTADRYPVATEDNDFSFDLRQMNIGLSNKSTHRVVFEIRGKDVIVHGVRHLSRRKLTPDDL